uniref:Uncharacterized protein n=1 Tax=Ditylenchus dipsaci TaxID=166011 RepID=A0A915E5K8_9BILA
MELPLLHLLLLYTNQLYLNVLNFGQIEEYLVLGVAAGSDFQAAHFLALLLFIAQSQVPVLLGRQLMHLSKAIRLQQFLHPNSQMLQDE